MRAFPVSLLEHVSGTLVLKPWQEAPSARCETAISFRSPLIACAWKGDWILSGMGTNASLQKRGQLFSTNAHLILIWPPIRICPLTRACGLLSRRSVAVPGGEPSTMLIASFRPLKQENAL